LPVPMSRDFNPIAVPQAGGAQRRESKGSGRHYLH
jgi:hypothetical protein